MRELSDDECFKLLALENVLNVVTAEDTLIGVRAGYAAGYRAAQEAMPPRAYSQSEARRIAVTVLRERGAHLVAALKGGSEYDGSNLIALMELHARAMYDAWAQEQTSGKAVFGSVPGHTEGQKMPGPLDHQSAATPAAGRPDAGAAQAVTDGPAADPDASVITYARIGLRYMHDPRVRATYSDLIDLAERMARERDDARAERDALREVVRAADGLRAECGQVPPMVQQRNVLHAYDAARAKVKP